MEIAFNTANKLKIEVDKSNHPFIANRISKFVANPSNFIVAILLGNNIALVVYSIFSEKILTTALIDSGWGIFKSPFVVFIIQTILATLVILLFAEFIPKVLFRKRSNRLLFFFALPITFIYYILYPLIWIFTKMGRLILYKKVKNMPKNIAPSFTFDDIDYLIDEFTPNNNKDVEHQQEMLMAQNVIDLKNVRIRECMRPRAEVVAAEIEDEIDEVRQKMIATGLSKIIIYKDSIDNTLGYVHAFDFFKNPKKVAEILKNTITVPETMQADKLLKYFIANNKSIVIVVDEYGGTSGIVTLEDIMEEIFGEIYDEFDDVQTIVEEEIKKGVYHLSARLEIDYLNEKYDFNLPVSDSYETLGGMLMLEHGDIPDEGDELEIAAYCFKVLKATDNKVVLVELEIRN
ncbi:hemolysin [Bacteroidia bacterium]|nr:hemolysin [Bacteroidia bacterium]